MHFKDLIFSVILPPSCMCATWWRRKNFYVKLGASQIQLPVAQIPCSLKKKGKTYYTGHLLLAHSPLRKKTQPQLLSNPNCYNSHLTDLQECNYLSLCVFLCLSLTFSLERKRNPGTKISTTTVSTKPWPPTNLYNILWDPLSVMHWRLSHWVSHVGEWHRWALHPWPWKVAPCPKWNMTWRWEHYRSTNSRCLTTWIHTCGLLNRLSRNGNQSRLTCNRALLPLLHCVTIVDTSNVMDAWSALILVDWVQAYEVFLCMACYLCWRSGDYKIPRYAPPIALPKFCQP